MEQYKEEAEKAKEETTKVTMELDKAVKRNQQYNGDGQVCFRVRQSVRWRLSPPPDRGILEYSERVA